MLGKSHIELDGTKYKLAESGEGSHYDLAGEPLRPPNAVSVQGEQGTFQVRPDLLLWRITDWSEGDGQIKYNPQEPARHFELQNVDPFTEPGKLKPGERAASTDYTAGGVAAIRGEPVRAMSGLWFVDFASDNVREWDDVTEDWGAAINNGVGQTAGANRGVCGDGNALYYIESGTANVWKYDGAFSTISAGTITTSVVTQVAQLGPYVYVWRTADADCWEIAKSGASTTKIHDPGGPDSGKHLGQHIVPGDNRLYAMHVTSGETTIYEITPTTAAGEGFAAEIKRFTSFEGESLWWQNGTLFVIGASDNERDEKTVLYFIPGQSWGTIGRIRQGHALGQSSSSPNGGKLLEHGFLTKDSAATSDTETWDSTLHIVDAVSGGHAIQTSDATASYTGTPVGPVEYRGNYFWGFEDQAYILWTGFGYEKYAFATSPLHDFDLADEKVLSSIRVVTEGDVPADWEVKVYYGLDTATPDTLAVTQDSTDGSAKSVALSSAATPITFDHLSVKVVCEYTGVANPVTTRPVVLQVEVRAQLAKKPKRWRYLLNMQDDQSALGETLSGATKIERLEASIAKSVVTLKDGYKNRAADVYTETDVVIDTYRFILDKPGEGRAYVELVEVLS